MSGVVWAVIKREYLQRVRSRWFVVGTVVAPLLLLALTALPILLASDEEAPDQRLAVVDGTGQLYTGVAARLSAVGYEVEEWRDRVEVEQELSQAVTDGRLGGFLLLDDATLSRGEAVFFSRDNPSAVRRAMLQQAVVQTALALRLGGESADVQALLAGGRLDVDLLSSPGSETDEARFVVAYVGAFLLYMVLIFYAVAVMRSVLEEKTSRIVEVIISSMRPYDLMLGKILGVGAVGLTQLGIWALMVAGATALGLPRLAADRADIPVEFLAEVAPDARYLALFGVFFLGGYFLYSGVYAAVGAMCNSDEEAQQAQFPVVMLLVIPIVFVIRVIEAPTAVSSVVLSFVPFFTPILMFARAVAGGVTAVELVLSVMVMVLAILAVAWVAGRIYKVGILMSGKRPSIPEVIRWVREA